MRKCLRLYQAAMVGLAFPVVAYATPIIYTDTQGDEVGSTNAARDIWAASIDDDGTNLYVTINDNPGANLATNNFDYGIAITTGVAGAGGDTSANTKTLGNAYDRNISIGSSSGGMLGWTGLFGVGGAGTAASPFTGYGFNDYVWNTSSGTWIGKTSLNSTTAGVPFHTQTGGANPSSITVAVPLADFSSVIPSSLGSVIKFDIYSTGTTAGQTAYDSLADSSPTNSTNSSTTPFVSTVLDSYTIQNTGPLQLVWNNFNSSGTIADGQTWDSAINGIAGGLINQNWLDGAGSTNPIGTFFFPNNAVTFNDSNNGHYAVALNSTVKPAAVTFNNSSGNYTLGGTGSISGTASLIKLGTSSVTLSTANNFTGGVNVNGGTLILGNSAALGYGGLLAAGQNPGATFVNTGGTLDLGGQTLTEPITLNGGTLTNSNGSAATLTSGIKGVGFSSPASAFSVNAAVTFTGGNGSGAGASPILALTQGSISLPGTGKGSGFSTVPTVTITGGGGSGATAIATLGLSSASATITNGGTGYTVAPTVTITGGGGTGATATPNISGGVIVGITITSAGTGYTTVPTFNISGGTYTTAASNASGNATHFVVNGLTLSTGGTGFTSLPSLNITGGGGTGAAGVILDSHFSLLGIQETSAGSGYTSPPTATYTATTGAVTLGSVEASSVALASTSSIGGVGNISIAAPITGAGGLNKVGVNILTLSGLNNYTGATNVSGGTVILSSAGALPSGTNLNVGAGDSVFTSNLGTAVPFTVGSLSIAGTLDLNNNALIVHNSSIGAITTLITSGYNYGAWNGGSGIVSTAAAGDTTHLTALGVIQNSIDGTTTGSVLDSTFEGQPSVNSDILVKYTYFGDTDLNGEVDGTDYSRIDYAYLNNQNSSNPQMTGWFNGDFNYDGVINGSDYTLIDNAYNAQGSLIASEIATPTAQIAPVGVFAVPEPATLSLIGIGIIGLLGRRRGSQH